MTDTSPESEADMVNHREFETDYECVEPDLGAELWRYDTPEIDPELQTQLTNHLSICAACRQQLALHRRMTDMPPQVRAGYLRRREARSRLLGTSRGTGVAAVLSLAACLLLMFLLPPQQPPETVRSKLLRREGVPAQIFLRPVPGEVVPVVKYAFKWHPVDNASGYVLEIGDSAGHVFWRTETQATSVWLPAHIELPADTDLIAHLEIIPPDLSPYGGYAVSFRSGSLWAFTTYRADITPTWVWVIGGLGLVLLATSLISRAARPRVA